jgi:hypothetical protein
LTHGDKGPEISVRRYDNTLFLLGTFEDAYVVCGLQTLVAYVSRIVSGPAQSGRDGGRKRVVDEESQDMSRSGSSRSRTASAA